MNQIYFTADLHFGHANILKHSPDLRFDVGIDSTLANLHFLTLEDIYNAATEKIAQAGSTSFTEYASNNYKTEVR